jgi:hypothetical protein
MLLNPHKLAADAWGCCFCTATSRRRTGSRHG